jgi:sugar lactone lactonase YvrE
MATTHVDVAVECEAALGECPMWDEREGRLYWVDILGGNLHRLDEGGHRVEPIGAPLAAVVPTSMRGSSVILGRETVRWRRGPNALELARVPLPEPDMRLNDAKCDPMGRLWAGTMSTKGRPVAALFCIDHRLRVEQRVAGLTISNGLGWSADGGEMYHVDTPTGRIYAYEFDLDTGALGRKRVLTELDRGAGVPDGLCVDIEGFVWVAIWGGGAVHRYAPKGSLDGILEVPTQCPTSCSFGGASLDILYVTSSRAGAAEAGADLEHAGSLFQASVGIRGNPVARFDASLEGSLT